MATPARGIARRLDGARAAAVVFVCALLAFGVQSLGWSLRLGRDWQDYVIYWHEVWHSEPLFPALMLARMPLTPLVFGPLLDLGGRYLAEVGAGVMFAIAVLAWTAAARRYGRKAALVMAVLLILLPAYGGFFHQISSDPVFACALALTAALTLRTAARPSTALFAAAGVTVFLLILARPAAQPFLLLAVLPLGLRGPVRMRLQWAGTTLGVAASLLVAWMGYNELRYGDFTVARGGQAGIPFYRALVVDDIVERNNGSASRDLVAAIERDLLSREPYRSWGFDIDELLHSRSTWVVDDLVPVVDARWGWGSDHHQLFAAGLEAVRAHPSTYVSGVTRTAALFVLAPYQGPPDQPPWVGDADLPDFPTDAVIGAPGRGRRMPGRVHAAQSVYSISLVNNWVLSPSARFEVRPGLEPLPGVVWSQQERRELRWRSQSDARRYQRLRSEVIATLRDASSSSRSAEAASVLGGLSLFLPPIAIWSLLALGAWILWRPEGLWPPALLALASGAVILETALGFPVDLNYAQPFVPAFVLVALAALTGSRRRAGGYSSSKIGLSTKPRR